MDQIHSNNVESLGSWLVEVLLFHTKWKGFYIYFRIEAVAFQRNPALQLVIGVYIALESAANRFLFLGLNVYRFVDFT